MTPAATHGIEAAITRCRSYLEAGADMVFIDAIPGFDEITRALDEIDGLLSVNLMDAVTGVRTDPIPIAELRRVGVARVSIPVASILVAHRAMERFFAGLHAADGQGDPELVTPFDDYLEIVGLPHYLDAAGYRA